MSSVVHKAQLISRMDLYLSGRAGFYGRVYLVRCERTNMSQSTIDSLAVMIPVKSLISSSWTISYDDSVNLMEMADSLSAIREKV